MERCSDCALCFDGQGDTSFSQLVCLDGLKGDSTRHPVAVHGCWGKCAIEPQSFTTASEPGIHLKLIWPAYNGWFDHQPLGDMNLNSICRFNLCVAQTSSPPGVGYQNIAGPIAKISQKQPQIPCSEPHTLLGATQWRWLAQEL